VTEHLQKPAVLKKRHRKDLILNDNNINKIICRGNMHLEPDHKILKLLISSAAKQDPDEVNQEAEQQISAINNTILRRHFRELTESFLRPFQVYFGFDSKILIHPEFNPYLNIVDVPAWDEDLFLEDIRRAPKGYFKGLPLRATSVAGSTRASLLKLYSKFFTSPHFYPWFHRKREIAKARIKAAVIVAIQRINLSQLIDGQTISNGAKMYHAIKRWLKQENNAKTKNFDLYAILLNHLKIVTNAIPSDTMEVLMEGGADNANIAGRKLSTSGSKKKSRRQQQKAQKGQPRRGRAKKQRSTGKQATSVDRTKDVLKIMSVAHQLDFSLQEQYFRRPSR